MTYGEPLEAVEGVVVGREEGQPMAQLHSSGQHTTKAAFSVIGPARGEEVRPMQRDARLVELGHERAPLQADPWLRVVAAGIWFVEAERGRQRLGPFDHQVLAAHHLGVVTRIETKARRENLAYDLRQLVVQDQEGRVRRRRQRPVAPRQDLQLLVVHVCWWVGREGPVLDR